MATGNMSIRIGIATADFEAAMVRLGEAMKAAMPSLQAVSRALRAWYNDWPGMPYTAPSLWDASQMAADR